MREDSSSYATLFDWGDKPKKTKKQKGAGEMRKNWKRHHFKYPQCPVTGYINTVYLQYMLLSQSYSRPKNVGERNWKVFTLLVVPNKGEGAWRTE